MNALAITLCLLVWCARIPSQSYSVSWHKIAAGGGTSTGGAYQISGTIGQAEAGGPLTTGAYPVTGGYWNQVVAVQTPGAPLLSIRHAGLR